MWNNSGMVPLRPNVSNIKKQVFSVRNKKWNKKQGVSFKIKKLVSTWSGTITGSIWFWTTLIRNNYAFLLVFIVLFQWLILYRRICHIKVHSWFQRRKLKRLLCSLYDCRISYKFWSKDTFFGHKLYNTLGAEITNNR